jgi:Ca2+-binding EF-hand superfamily protein
MKMIKPRTIALALSLAATTVAGAAYAQAANRDAPVTRAEAQAKAQERFARMDANKDGKLDQADREARRAAMFDRLDTDNNGQISRAEFDAAATSRGERGGKKGWGGRGGGRHHGGMMMGKMADGNATVTQAEFVQKALERFDAMDANRDGTVTKEERQAARQAMRENWKNRAGQSAPTRSAN